MQIPSRLNERTENNLALALTHDMYVYGMINRLPPKLRSFDLALKGIHFFFTMNIILK